MQSMDSTRIIAAGNVRNYFHDSVTSAAANQNVDANDRTIDYVVDVLVTFMRSDRLFEPTPDGHQLKPLAMLYFQALEAQSQSARNRSLQRLGDVALFIAGLFSDSLNRKLVDIDYYIAMGGNAYGFLADNLHIDAHPGERDVFEELADKFVSFVDVLMEVSEQARPACQSDILKLYDLWLKTGSRRAHGQLRNLGILPGNFSTNSH